jgi:cell division protein ZapA (FtsZ GTPase activity inhibitor)
MDEEILHIRLLGTTLSIKSGTHPEYIKKVIRYYQTKLQETESISPLSDPVKLSILTSFNIIDELFKIDQNRGQAGSSCSTMDEVEITETAQRLIDSINQVLEEN